MSDPRSAVLSRVLSERLIHDAKYGLECHHSVARWMVVLGEEFGEVCRAIREGDIPHLEDELIQLAAATMAFAEDIKANGVEGLDAVAVEVAQDAGETPPDV